MREERLKYQYFKKLTTYSDIGKHIRTNEWSESFLSNFSLPPDLWLFTIILSIFWQLVLWQFLNNSGNVCFPDKNYIFIWTTTSIYYIVFAVSESCSIVSDSLHPLWNLQARILEWVAFPFSRGSSQPKDQTEISFITGRFPGEPQRKPNNTGVGSPSLLHQIFLTQKSNWDLLHCRQILYQQAMREIFAVCSH